MHTHTTAAHTIRYVIMALILLTVAEAGAQGLSVSLAGSMHNGSGVPCFGKKEGTITSTVSGGSAPYSYLWSNGETTPHLTGIAAGFYSLEVKDAVAAVVKVEITLTEPEPLKVKPTVSSFENGENISCFECNNGWIQIVTTQGTPPYTYAWDDSPSTSANRYGLGPKEYAVNVTDANGCEEGAVVKITQPERSDWTMSGNAGTNPAVQFIGTSDAQDLVFKSNGVEGLRLTHEGALKAPSLAFNEGYRLVMVDSTGQLKLLTDSDYPEHPLAPVCPDRGSNLPWTFCGNIAHPSARLGTKNNQSLLLVSNDQVRMVLHKDGKVGVGTFPPAGPVEEYRMYVEDGIVTRDVLVKLGDWPDYVFHADYKLMPFSELRQYLERNKHLPGIPAAAELEVKGGVALGAMQRDLVRTVEEQALYILELEERLRDFERRLTQVEENK